MEGARAMAEAGDVQSAIAAAKESQSMWKEAESMKAEARYKSDSNPGDPIRFFLLAPSPDIYTKHVLNTY